MNDADEDAEAIKRVNDKMSIATGLPIPHGSVLAPASLYLTAILEYVYPPRVVLSMLTQTSQLRPLGTLVSEFSSNFWS